MQEETADFLSIELLIQIIGFIVGNRSEESEIMYAIVVYIVDDVWQHDDGHTGCTYCIPIV